MSKYSSPLIGLLFGAIALSGCCVDRVYRPSGCDGNWDAVLGSCESCGVCGGDCEGRTPCQSLKHLLTCGAGCGELYWGEWTNHPPDECDPCDGGGNWIGARTCPPTLWQRLTSCLSGRQCSESCCDDAAEYVEHGDEGEMIIGEEIFEEEAAEEVLPKDAAPQTEQRLHGQPRPAAPPQLMPERAAARPRLTR